MDQRKTIRLDGKGQVTVSENREMVRSSEWEKVILNHSPMIGQLKAALQDIVPHDLDRQVSIDVDIGRGYRKITLSYYEDGQLFSIEEDF